MLRGMEHFFGSLDTLHVVFLVLALGLAFGFEFVNGFHDTANAVATVIYTHSLPPYVAVVWSGMWNLIGVLTSTGAVAFGVVALLPVELVMNVGSAAGFAMVFSLLISAIIWNLGHLVPGAAGIEFAHADRLDHGGGADEFDDAAPAALRAASTGRKAKDVGMSLLVSPLVGFVCTALLFLLVKALIKKPELYSEPDPKKAPPLWIRGILCLTCTGVSFAHGSNDGQKGMGLIMLILIGIVPGVYALDLDGRPGSLDTIAGAIARRRGDHREASRRR